MHPRHLDRQALIAGWREALLAQAVLAGRTKGYQHHPQLQRFRATPEPLAAIGTYLGALADEADARGYRFDRSRILCDGPSERLTVTTGQLAFERRHLAAKLAVRSPEMLGGLPEVVGAHPLFAEVDGGIEAWERP